MASSTRFELLGRLCGYFCDECQTPLAGATIRLYQPAPGRQHHGDGGGASEGDLRDPDR